MAAACALAEEGWRPESGELMVVVTADEEAGAEHGAKWLCEQHPEQGPLRHGGQRGRRAALRLRRPARCYTVCVAEKGVFRFTLTTDGHRGPRLAAADRGQRADQARAAGGGDGRAPALARGRRPRRRPSSTRARPGSRTTSDGGAGRGRGARPPGGGAAGPDPRRDPRSHDGQRLAEDQRHPRARGAARGLPRAARPGRGARPAPDRGGARDRRLPPGVRRDRDRQRLGGRDRADGPHPRLRGRRGARPTGSPRWSCPASPTRAGSARPSPTAWPTASSPSARWTCSRPCRSIHGADERIPVEDLGFAARFFAGLAPKVLG